MRHLVVAGVGVALSVSNAVGQTGSNASPGDIARQFFAAEREGRWLMRRACSTSNHSNLSVLDPSLTLGSLSTIGRFT